MDRRTILAVTLCFLIFFIWQKIYIDPQVQKQRVQQTTVQQKSSEVETPRDKSAVLVAPSPRVKEKPLQTEKLSVANGEILFGNGASVFQDWTLTHYKGTNLSLGATLQNDKNIRLAFDDPRFSYILNVRGDLRLSNGKVIWSYEDDLIKIERSFTAQAEESFLDGQFQIYFKENPPKFAFVTLDAARPKEADTEELDRQLSFSIAGAVQRSFLKDETKTQFFQNPTRWMMAMGHYFGIAVVAKQEALPSSSIQRTGPQSVMGSLVYPIQGDQLEIPLRVYFGAKELELLRKVDRSLDQAVDFGWFTVIAYPILQFMRFLYKFVHNYGVAIILLTLLLKVLTYPLTLKSMKSMKQMAKLQPQIQKIRDKHKSDPQKMNQEMLQFMRSNGYNPMAGCFPILIQMPVFIALYNVLRTSVELYQAPFAFWITDLSLKDPYFVTPILLTIAMYISQKLTPTTATDPMQQKMMQLMPIIFGAMMVTLPSGLTLYMLTNSVAGIFQQIILNKKLDVGHVTPAVVSR